MYEVAVLRNFIAQHYLIGGDFGKENELHSHGFCLQVKFSGSELDEHCYLFDISKLNVLMDSVVERYQDQTLNDLEEFKGRNPSIELFCRNIFDRLAADFRPQNLERMHVTLWEDKTAWASYEDRLHQA